MRHAKKTNSLSRTHSHRHALLAGLAVALIRHKRIKTTVAKAKALRRYVEPLITKAKENSTHARRVVFAHLRDKDSIGELFGPVVDKVSDRPGGYTRIIRLGKRLGDVAEMCMIELVDFNTWLEATSSDQKKSAKSRRSRRGGASKSQKVEAAPAAVETIEEETAPKEDVEATAVGAEETPFVPLDETAEEETTSREDVEAEGGEAEAEAEAAVPEDTTTEDPAAEESKEEESKD